jgi:hypothetical protein
MKVLKTLLKLRKKELDDLLIQIANLEAQEENLKLELRLMLEAAAQETVQYNSTEYAFMLEQYLSHVRKQEKLYKKQIADLVIKIDNMRDCLFDQFTELKKLEITLARRQKAARLLLEQKENKDLDEATTLRYKSVRIK